MKFRISLVPIFIISAIITVGCINGSIASYIDKRPLWETIYWAAASIFTPYLLLDLVLKKDVRKHHPLSFTSQLIFFPPTFGFFGYMIASEIFFNKTQWNDNKVTNAALLIGLLSCMFTFLFIVLKRKIRL